MATIQIVISQVKRISNNISFRATQDNNVIERTINISEFDSWRKFADWIINQNPDFILEPSKEKTLTITFHNQTDPETETTYRVVDNVVVV